MRERADWQQYLAAAQELDALRRAQHSAAAAATRTLSTARAQLAAARQQVDAQRHALTDEADRRGVRPPSLVPTEREQAAAFATAASPEAVPAALQRCQDLIATADAALARARTRRPWWRRLPGLRSR